MVTNLLKAGNHNHYFFGTNISFNCSINTPLPLTLILLILSAIFSTYSISFSFHNIAFSSIKVKCEFYCTTLLAQLELANASGFALKANFMPMIYPIASFNASLLLKFGLVLMSACTSISTLYKVKILHNA